MLGPEKQTNNNKKKIRKERERKRNQKERGPREGKFWKVLHLAAWNVE